MSAAGNKRKLNQVIEFLFKFSIFCFSLFVVFFAILQAKKQGTACESEKRYFFPIAHTTLRPKMEAATEERRKRV